jgi:2-polyprenyl-3-methyl-5-hydroxy-6-metoxy-1,4-benzoquinol methylase
MTGSAESPPALASGQFVWEFCLGPNALENTEYHHGLNKTLREILRRPPKHALELGCAAGRLAEFVREKYPDVHYTGIEMNATAANVARTRLHHVIVRRLEDVDFAAEGIAPGTIDTFFAGDVLEHLYDPWHALLRIRPLLTPDAQVVVSLPNVRNLFIHAQLHNEGVWRYDTHGLLDITHIRFFAFRDILRLMNETGFVIDDVKCNLDSRYAELWNANAGKPSVTLQVGRLKIENVSSTDLQEYCTLQYVVLAHPKGATGQGDATARPPIPHDAVR